MHSLINKQPKYFNYIHFANLKKNEPGLQMCAFNLQCTDFCIKNITKNGHQKGLANQQVTASVLLSPRSLETKLDFTHYTASQWPQTLHNTTSEFTSDTYTHMNVCLMLCTIYTWRWHKGLLVLFLAVITEIKTIQRPLAFTRSTVWEKCNWWFVV